MMDSPLPIINLSEARAAIAAIKRLNLRNATIEEIKDLLTPLFRGYKVIAPRFEAGVRLFRMRICDKPNNIREVFYPPPCKTKLGRVNRPSSPVLYCCTARAAPFFEARPAVGSCVVIVRWITMAPMLVNHVGYTKKAFVNLRSKRSDAGWGPEPVEMPDDEKSAEINEFLAEIFTQRVPAGSEYLYKLTVAISEKLFMDSLFDGLIYPTIGMSANADNFALKPTYADKHLRFLKAEFVRVDAVRDSQFDIKVLDTATKLGPKGEILWKGRLDRWVIKNQGDYLIFATENGEWVARDGSGKVVEPE